MKADKEKVTRSLKIARGQLDGVLRMIEEDRYCVDISNQLLATQALLKRVNQEILRAHIRGCVRDALQTDEPTPNWKRLCSCWKSWLPETDKQKEHPGGVLLLVYSVRCSSSRKRCTAAEGDLAYISP